MGMLWAHVLRAWLVTFAAVSGVDSVSDGWAASDVAWVPALLSATVAGGLEFTGRLTLRVNKKHRNDRTRTTR